MEQRIRELVDKLNEYSKAYYVLDAPKISDKEYDELYDELLRLEEQVWHHIAGLSHPARRRRSAALL